MKPNYFVRWLIDSDLPHLEAAERFNADARGGCWWVGRAGRTDAGVYAVEDGSCLPVGFAAFRQKPGKLVLSRLVTRPDLRRQGVGTALVERLRLRLGTRGLHELVAWVGEEAVGTQLFLRETGFTATRVKDGRIRFVAGPLDHVPDAIYSDSFAGVVG